MTIANEAITKTITLNDAELGQCCFQAAARMLVSRMYGRNQSRSVERSWFEHYKNELVGVIAECAYCKWRNIYQSKDLDVFHTKTDTTDGVEIRSITSMDHCLIVRNDDPDERKYILVYVNRNAECQMIGWIRGIEAKKKQWERNPGGKRPSWFVPMQELNEFDLSPSE